MEENNQLIPTIIGNMKFKYGTIFHRMDSNDLEPDNGLYIRFQPAVNFAMLK